MFKIKLNIAQKLFAGFGILFFFIFLVSIFSIRVMLMGENGVKKCFVWLKKEKWRRKGSSSRSHAGEVKALAQKAFGDGYTVSGEGLL